jgi:hypothetical protein
MQSVAVPVKPVIGIPALIGNPVAEVVSWKQPSQEYDPPDNGIQLIAVGKPQEKDMAVAVAIVKDKCRKETR